FNIMLSMPRGVDPASVKWAAREFAKAELADHKYVIVLHDHQANPHVHISVRAESKHGQRLNPRKTDLHRWRETFAARLRERGIEAEATRQATRGASQRYPALWQVKAIDDGRLARPVQAAGNDSGMQASRDAARTAWRALAAALTATGIEVDRLLARSIDTFAAEAPHRAAPDPTQPRAHRVPATQTGHVRTPERSILDIRPVS
ncbi:MAG: relaxase/mobilization nuclease domain-containing protein, partial [Planctomycetes bacterium]|nr:relaxase/mobilization nuclease domain-containing protein [Planctomycetota bacterium]